MNAKARTNWAISLRRMLISAFRRSSSAYMSSGSILPEAMSSILITSGSLDMGAGAGLRAGDESCESCEKCEGCEKS